MSPKLKNNKHYNSKETIVLASRINRFFRLKRARQQPAY